MNKGKLFVLTGPSGTGKGTLLERVLKAKENLFLSISATTRQPREGEVHGVSYYFLTHEEFDDNIAKNNFLEYASYVGNSYGTLESPVNEKLEQGFDVILEIETQGAMSINEKRPDAIMIFIEPPSFEELESRLRGRGTDEDEKILKRLETAKHELMQKDKFDYIVVNADLEKATNELLEILEKN